MTTTTTFKVVVGDDCRRITMGGHPPKMEQVLEQVKTSFNKNSIESALYWQDDEGDFITVSTDEDLKEGIVFSGCKPLKLFLGRPIASRPSLGDHIEARRPALEIINSPDEERHHRKPSCKAIREATAQLARAVKERSSHPGRYQVNDAIQMYEENSSAKASTFQANKAFPHAALCAQVRQGVSLKTRPIPTIIRSSDYVATHTTPREKLLSEIRSKGWSSTTCKYDPQSFVKAKAQLKKVPSRVQPKHPWWVAEAQKSLNLKEAKLKNTTTSASNRKKKVAFLSDVKTSFVSTAPRWHLLHDIEQSRISLTIREAAKRSACIRAFRDDLRIAKHQLTKSYRPCLRQELRAEIVSAAKQRDTANRNQQLPTKAPLVLSAEVFAQYSYRKAMLMARIRQCGGWPSYKHQCSSPDGWVELQKPTTTPVQSNNIINSYMSRWN